MAEKHQQCIHVPISATSRTSVPPYISPCLEQTLLQDISSLLTQFGYKRHRAAHAPHVPQGPDQVQSTTGQISPDNS
jgi:hypothetical protein